MTVVANLLAFAREMRERTDPFPPMVTWQPVEANGGGPFLIVIDGSTGDTATDLGEAFAHMRDLAGPPEWVAVTLDSYAREHDPSTDPSTLAAAFKGGDMSVMEQMVVIVKHVGDDIRMIRQVYRHTPVDGWEWDREEYLDDSLRSGDPVLDAVLKCPTSG